MFLFLSSPRTAWPLCLAGGLASSFRETLAQQIPETQASSALGTHLSLYVSTAFLLFGRKPHEVLPCKVSIPPYTRSGSVQQSERSLQHRVGLDVDPSSATDKPWSFFHQEKLGAASVFQTVLGDRVLRIISLQYRQCRSEMWLPDSRCRSRKGNVVKPKEHRRHATPWLGSG